MPTYTFKCKKCDLVFEDVSTISEYDKKIFRCKGCKNKNVIRQYKEDRIMVNDGPKTLGMLADLNASKMGESQIIEKRAQEKTKKGE